MTITQIKEHNKKAGFYFFEPATMRFFRSKVESKPLIEKEDKVFFITSEQFKPSNGPAELRMYTIREYNKATGDVTTVGEFNKYKTKQEAVRQARFIK